jgi:hypothetical protein
LADAGPVHQAVERYAREHAVAQGEQRQASKVVTEARATLAGLGLVAEEKAGPPLADSGTAQRHVSETAKRLAEAAAAFDQAEATLRATETAATAAASDASDILRGRRVIFALAVLTGIWCLMGLFS